MKEDHGYGWDDPPEPTTIKDCYDELLNIRLELEATNSVLRNIEKVLGFLALFGMGLAAKFLFKWF